MKRLLFLFFNDKGYLSNSQTAWISSRLNSIVSVRHKDILGVIIYNDSYAVLIGNTFSLDKGHIKEII